ncbi:MAG: sulfate adenylyltransferase [Campylobacter sp.]
MQRRCKIRSTARNFISNSTENFIKNSAANPAYCELVARIDVSDVYAPSASEIAGSVFQNAYAEQTAVHGRITLLKNELAEQIARIKKIASSLAAPKISAFFTCADPIHRVHERLIRHMIDKADFVVIFLTGTNSADALPYELRKKTLSYLLQNFLVAQRAMMIDLGSLAIFDDKPPALQCAIAKNLGINKIIFGQNHANMELFFEGGGVHSVLDEYQKRGEIEILLMPEYVYCEKCKVLVSTKNCPHGAHHHVHYRAQNLKSLLRAGILPPAIFMRKEISAMILSELFPARFSDLQKLYDELFPNSGILQSHGESEFYEQLMQLYQTSALKT